MSLQEMKTVVISLVFTSGVMTLVICLVMYKFAEITYRRAHKNTAVQTVQKLNSSKLYRAVVFDIDCKNKTLQEIQAERMQMKKILGGI